MKYRKLKPGERVREGDEVARKDQKLLWIPAMTTIGCVVKSDSVSIYIYRRPITEVDAMVAATKRARGKTTLGKLESLIAERIRWQKKVTVAQNKLAGTNKRIAELAAGLAKERFDRDLESNQKAAPAAPAAPVSGAV
jgi:hypothetical protein